MRESFWEQCIGIEMQAQIDQREVEEAQFALVVEEAPKQKEMMVCIGSPRILWGAETEDALAILCRWNFPGLSRG